VVKFPSYVFKGERKAFENAPIAVLLIRIAVLSLIILALAHPVKKTNFNKLSFENALIVVEDGWQNAKNWKQKKSAIKSVLDVAKRNASNVFLMTTAVKKDGSNPVFIGPVLPQKAMKVLKSLKPKNWKSDYSIVEKNIEKLVLEKTLQGNTKVFWLSSNFYGENLQTAMESAQLLGDLELIINEDEQETLKFISSVSRSLNKLEITVKRAKNLKFSESQKIAIFDEDDNALSKEILNFDENKDVANAVFYAPETVLNRAFKIQIISKFPVSSETYLLGDWKKKKTVGIVSYQNQKKQNPLLSKDYYVKKAIEPFAKIKTGSIKELLNSDLSTIVITDGFEYGEEKGLENFVKNGGTLLCFSKKGLQNSDLFPVKLKEGLRNMGGEISQEKNQNVADFPEKSLFYGIKNDNQIFVKTQLIAESSIDSNDKTIASLQDGTQLVTARNFGKGRVVFFHISSDASWSNLPLSTMFAQMLERIVLTSKDDFFSINKPIKLSLQNKLSAFAKMKKYKNKKEKKINLSDITSSVSSHNTPAGIYVAGSIKKGVNLCLKNCGLEHLEEIPYGAEVLNLSDIESEFDFSNVLYFLALSLLVFEQFFSLFLKDALPKNKKFFAIVFCFVFMFSNGVKAENIDYKSAIKAVSKTSVAIVKTGNKTIDEVAQNAFSSLEKEVLLRAGIALGKTAILDVENDELSLYPMVYWAISDAKKMPSEKGIKKINEYIASGGIVWFDTRNFAAKVSGSNVNANVNLNNLAQFLSIPAVKKVEKNHAVFNSFYEINSCSGRMEGDGLWLTQNSFNAWQNGIKNDGVSPIIIGSADWIGAWVKDKKNRPLFSAFDGEDGRENSFRCGVNIIIYALMGNYNKGKSQIDLILSGLKK
jgi:hypothetical protein